MEPEIKDLYPGSLEEEKDLDFNDQYD